MDSFFIAAVSANRETVEDNWTVAVYTFDDEGNLVEQVFIEEPSDNPCYSECVAICVGIWGEGCSKLATALGAITCGPVCWFIAFVVCFASGVWVCPGLCDCICDSEQCGSLPGCDQYPPCICDPDDPCD